jgi:hypothetical protein
MRFESPNPRHSIQPEPSRYRLRFEGDHTLRPANRADWWRDRLGGGIRLGRQPASHDVARRRRIGDTT